ncbi:glycoside hydrolase family 16 [Prevotella sp. CAG:1058]|nr:glycoside hydrolase family 16 [Prevotella sp. CAG:1058]
MNKKVSLIITLLCGALTACSSDSDDSGIQVKPDDPVENVLFFDDFSTFDNSVWTKETHEPGWTNQELQAYEPGQVKVGKDGSKSVLMLTAEWKNGRIVSGRVNSKGKKSFKYGTISASIKLPETANGLWPAFWMMGDNDKEWPACGEIDIMEMGDKEGIATGTASRRVNTAIHYGPTPASHEQQYHASAVSTDLQDGQYHTYTLTWDESKAIISIDDKPFHSFDIKDNPYFHDKFFILFNLAVGGTFTGITDASGVTALKKGDKATMYVDWIKIINHN